MEEEGIGDGDGLCSLASCTELADVLCYAPVENRRQVGSRDVGGVGGVGGGEPGGGGE